MEVVYINIKIEKRNGEWGGGYKLKHPLWEPPKKNFILIGRIRSDLWPPPWALTDI